MWLLIEQVGMRRMVPRVTAIPPTTWDCTCQCHIINNPFNLLCDCGSTHHHSPFDTDQSSSSSACAHAVKTNSKVFPLGGTLACFVYWKTNKPSHPKPLLVYPAIIKCHEAMFLSNI